MKIVVTSLTAGGSKRKRCLTRDSARTNRLACLGRPKAALKVYEVPWPGAPGLPRDCLCSSPPGLLPFVFVSNSHVVEVRFEAVNMSATDDFKNMFFEATYEFIKTSVCTKSQKISGASGEINLRLPSHIPDEVSNFIHSM